MRRQLLTAVSLSVLISSGVLAQETVDDERTSPVSTSDADGSGNANDIVISSTGRVTLDTSGTAVTLDSDNNVTTESGSIITSEDVDNDVGIELLAGNSGTLTHGGRINLTEEYLRSPSDGTELVFDTDGDGIADAPETDLVDTDFDGIPDTLDTDPDGPFAESQSRTGILVSGAGSFIGDVILESTARITVEGQDSFGIRTLDTADIDGNMNLDGTINIVGENSRGVSIESDITGDFINQANVSVQSPGGEGIVLEGDVGGLVFLGGAISVNGYTIGTRQIEAAYLLLDAGDDDLSVGSAVVVNGSADDGVLFTGGTFGVSSQLALGSAPSVLIQPGDDATSDQIIGLIVVTEDLDPTPDTTDDRDFAYGLGLNGITNAQPLYDGQDANGVVIAGNDSSGTMYNVDIEGGVRVGGSVTATAYDATATGLRLGDGSIVPVLIVDGSITARTNLGFEADEFADDRFGTSEAYGVLIEAGSNIQRIENNGTISSFVTGDGVSTTAIKVSTNSLTEIVNTLNIISATGGLVDDAGDVAEVAIDASDMTSGLILTQTDVDLEDDVTPGIRGDILFGSGDDTLNADSGNLVGDIAFGDGVDSFSLENTTFTGGITDSDGQLSISVDSSSLSLVGNEALFITDANFVNDSQLDITVSNALAGSSSISASGTVSFDASSELSVSLSELVGESFTVNIIEADTLTFADEDNAFSFTDSPYLYNASLSRDETDTDTLVLTLERKTTEELGMNANQSAAFDSTLAAFDVVTELGGAVASLRTQSDFFQAYDQLLPEYAASAIQFALASNDAAQGALATRLHNARLAPDEMAGLWAQEFGYFTDRNNSPMAPGYRGEGIGLAVGFDRPIGPFYAVGFNLIGAASEIEEIDGNDDPMIAITGQLGAYAALDISGFDLSGSLGIGFDSFETERRILIGDFTSVNTADWTGWHATASAQLGRDIQAGNWIIRPELSLTYLSLFESGYSETAALARNAALALVVDDRESSVLTGAATLALARRYGTNTSWWSPSIRVGYRGDFGDASSDTTAQFGESGNPFTLQSESLPGSGVLVGLGFSAGSNYSTFSFGYDADIREDFIRHVARLMIRMAF